MTYDTDMSIIALSRFEPNAMFATTEDPDTIRRFTTLLDCGAVGGGSHHLRKVANTEGETFALKTLWPLGSCEENGPAITPCSRLAVGRLCQNVWLWLYLLRTGHPYGVD